MRPKRMIEARSQKVEGLRADEERQMRNESRKKS